MTIIQARNLTYYSRNDKSEGYTYYKPQIALLPREAFAEHPDVLEAYDTMVRLNEAIRDNRAAASRKRREADDAAATYQAKVTEALAAGTDPSKIKNPEPQLRAEAAAHDQFADDAESEATRHGHILGRLMRAAAADCFANTERQMLDAAEEVREAVQTLEGAWTSWSNAWNLRRRLSTLHYRGGMQTGVRPGEVPAEVRAALATIDDHLANLDRLKADEAELTRWREEQERTASPSPSARVAS